MPLTDIDLLDAETTADPYPALARMRELHPVHFSERQDGWMLFRHDDVAAAFADPRLSSNRITPLLDGIEGRSRSDVSAVLRIMADWLPVTDPPLHTRLRRLSARAFTPQRVRQMEARIVALVDDLLNAVAPRGGMDVVRDLAYPLPATVIAELIGAPAADRDRFREWLQALAAVAFGGADPDRYPRALAGMEQMLTYFRERIGIARARPGDDMITSLLEGDGSGEALADEEIAGMCALMLFAGHETTTNLIASAVLVLDRHPAQREELGRAPGLLNGAVEELLRFESPVKLVTRWVVEGFELRERRIARGQRVHLVLASANRDPERFVAPDALDLTRSPNPHLAFGRGIHACLGAQLARLEARIALGRLLERLPDLRVEDPAPPWVASRDPRSLEALAVSFTPAPAAA